MDASKTKNRKSDHIKICLEQNVEFKHKSTGFEDVTLIHRAVPTIDMDEINFELKFLNHTFKVPIIVGAMTGGHPDALKINENLAIAAQELGLGMGVGSQRAALESKELEKTYSIVRNMAPSTFLISNIGAPQIPNISIEDLNKLIDMISANALAIHLNKLQESIQLEGDTSFKNFLEKLNSLSQKIKVPIIVKETGSGVCKEDSIILEKNGASAIDISGAGGTSWAGVEAIRGNNKYGEFFWDWGIPTVISLVECVKSVKIPIIASGGIRNGLDIAKSFALGADLVSISLPLLKKANQGVNKIKEYIEVILRQLKISMYLLNVKNIIELKRVPFIITGRTGEYLKQRGINF